MNIACKTQICAFNKWDVYSIWVLFFGQSKILYLAVCLNFSIGFFSTYNLENHCADLFPQKKNHNLIISCDFSCDAFTLQKKA